MDLDLDLQLMVEFEADDHRRKYEQRLLQVIQRKLLKTKNEDELHSIK